MKAAATIHCRFVAQRDDLHRHAAALQRVWSLAGAGSAHAEPRRPGTRRRLPPLVSPETPCDFVSVRDVNRAFVEVATRTDLPGVGQHIGSGRETVLREGVEIAWAEMGLEVEPEWGTEPQRGWDAKVWVADPTLAAQELGWRVEDDVATGFRALADWLRGRPDLWPRFARREPGIDPQA